MTLKELDDEIKQIDCGMFITSMGKDNINSRPMLTITDDADFQTLYFFCMKNSQKIAEIKKNNQVAISYQEKDRGINLHISGTATVIDHPQKMQEHWDKKLNVWWKDEAYTEGICMIIVKIERYRYWTIGNSGEITLNDK